MLIAKFNVKNGAIRMKCINFSPKKKNQIILILLKLVQGFHLNALLITGQF